MKLDMPDAQAQQGDPPDLAVRNDVAEKVIALLFSLRPGQGQDGDEMAGHAWSLDAACLALSRAILAANGHLENDPADLIKTALANVTDRVERRRSQYFQQKLEKNQQQRPM